MKEIRIVLKKYLTVFLFFIRNSYIREMQYRANFFLMSFTTMFLNIYFLIFYLVLAMLTNNNFLGWNCDELLFFLGTEIICHSLFMSFCFFNVFTLPEKIKTGDFDFILLQPINTRFMLSTNQFDTSMFVQSFLGVGLCIYSLIKLEMKVSLIKFLLYVLFVINGVILMYLCAFMLMTLSFFFGRVFSTGTNFPYRGFFSLYWFARRPENIYTATTIKFLTYVCPLLLIINLPVKIMIKSVDKTTIIFALLFTILLFKASQIIWKKGLRRYESAGS